MSAQPKQFEGPALEPLLERIHNEVGPSARIVRAERSRQGGVMGFFAHQHFRLEVQPRPGDEHGDQRGDAAVTEDARPDGGAGTTDEVHRSVASGRARRAAPAAAGTADPFASLAEATQDVTEVSGPSGRVVPTDRSARSALPSSSASATPGAVASTARTTTPVADRRRAAIPAAPVEPEVPAGRAVPAERRSEQFDAVLQRVAAGLGEPDEEDGAVHDGRHGATDSELDELEVDITDDLDIEDGDPDDDMDEDDGIDVADHDDAEIECADRIVDAALAAADAAEVVDAALAVADAADDEPEPGAMRNGPTRWTFPAAVALPPFVAAPTAVNGNGRARRRGQRAAPSPHPPAADGVVAPSPTADPRVVTRLSEVGLAGELLELAGAGLAAGLSLDDALFTAFSSSPGPPPLPFRRGSLLAVVGPSAAAWAAAVELADEIGAPTVALAAMSGGRHLSAELVARSAMEAAEKAQGWRRSATAVVCVDAPVDRRSREWSRAVLGSVRPTAVWGVVDATAKPEDVRDWARALGGVDALLVEGVDGTVSPAAVLQVGIPVARIDARRAGPQRWTSLVRERVESW